MIGLQMTWDHLYEDVEEQLRLQPGQAAEVLGAWGNICRARQVSACPPAPGRWPAVLQ
jgi:hypothetical protein